MPSAALRVSDVLPLHADIQQRLVASAHRATRLDAAHLRGLRPSLNLFVWQNVLMELGGGFALSGDRALLLHGQGLILDLARGGWGACAFPEEIHRAFVLNGMAVFLEHTVRHWHSDDLAEAHELVGRIAAPLAAEAATQEWGRDIARRNAWNHAAVAFSAIATAGIMLPRHAEAAQWRALGLARIGAFFRHGVTEAGMTREGLAYCGFVFRNLSVPLHLARRRHVWDFQSERDNPELGKLARIPAWYEAEMFPGGGAVQNWNDSYWDPRYALRGFLTSFANLDPATCARVWNRLVGPEGDGSFGEDVRFLCSCLYESAMYPPEPGDMAQPSPEVPFACPEVGYVVDTDGAGVRASKLAFNSGEFIGGIHDQGDNNAFTLFLDGIPCVLDAGAANQRREGSFSSSFGHSGIVIDGKGQLPSGSGVGCSGRIIGMDLGAEYSFVAGDATRAYGSQGYNPVVHARRGCFLVKSAPCFAVVVDDVVTEGEARRFEMLLPTPVLSDSHVDVATGTVTGVVEHQGRRARLAMRVMGAAIAAIDCAVVEMPGQPPFERHARWSFAFAGREARIATLVQLVDLQDVAGIGLPAHVFSSDAAGARLDLQWPAGRRAEMSVSADGAAGAFSARPLPAHAG